MYKNQIKISRKKFNWNLLKNIHVNIKLKLVEKIV